MNRLQDKEIIHPEDNSAIRFLLSSFIAIDIISCASTRSSHYLDLDHKLLLERGEMTWKVLQAVQIRP